ncbi:MAG: CDP-alcohol phosphatidyltransferase family protein, partial [Chloroflexi bacterium]|nr:CDP-alcohol phosphatidyltransferase family protein [Chloroflexota bacterium]
QAWLVAGILVLAFGIFDLFDGTLARATGKVTTFGAFLDSTLDRAGEAITYIGIAAGCLMAGFLLGSLLAATAMAAAFLVSYVRAKAESLGYATGSGMSAVGLAPREVRLAIAATTLVTVGLAGAIAVSTSVNISCSPPVNSTGANACVETIWSASAWLLAAGLGLITLLATVTVIQRILHVRAQAKEGEPP